MRTLLSVNKNRLPTVYYKMHGLPRGQALVMQGPVRLSERRRAELRRRLGGTTTDLRRWRGVSPSQDDS